MSHFATLSELEPRQVLAVERLLAGDPVTTAAAAAGVDRSSVHRWLREDAVFRAAYNAARQDLFREVSSRLLGLASDALAAVEAAVRGGDARVAVAVLKGLGLLPGTAPTIGPEDPAEVASLDEAWACQSALRVADRTASNRSPAARVEVAPLLLRRPARR